MGRPLRIDSPGAFYRPRPLLGRLEPTTSGEARPPLGRRRFLRAALFSAGAVLTGAAARRAFSQAPGAAELRFVVLSDTHVGAPGDAARLEAAIPWVCREKPAFVLHCGDVVEHLATNAGELEAARRLLGEIPVPVHVVPGNHDVGPGDSEEERRPWRSAFGPSEQVARHGEWSFVGFDSMALALGRGGRKLEGEVFEFLEAQRPRLDGRRTVFFYHVPEDPLPLADSITWSETALERWGVLTGRLGPVAALAGHWHVGLRLPAASHPVLVSPPISGRVNLPTGYLRCSIKGDDLLCERVMIETEHKRELPGLVQWLLLPEGRPPA